MSDLARQLAELSPTKRALLERRLAALRESGGRTPPITRRAQPREPQSLSHEQRRLWLIHQLDPNSAAYNIPAALRLSGRLDAEALARALSEVVRRHESLRTTFMERGGEPLQLVGEPSELALPLTDLSALGGDAADSEVLRLAREEARRPFDLSKGPLLRAQLLRLDEREHVLILTMHHIVSDGWSVGVLVDEMAALYKAFSKGEASPLAELPIQYADYAAWQRDWLQGEELRRQLSYWREQLAGVPPLDLPFDRPRPAEPSGRGGIRRFEVGAELAERLRELARGGGATPFMLMLAALKVLLRHYTRQERIAVVCPVATRRRAETHGLIGFFLNTLVFCTDFEGEATLRELLGRVRRVCLEGYAHQDVPFEMLVEAAQTERVRGSRPPFRMAYTLQSVDDEPMHVEGLTVAPLDVTSETAQFDLVLNMLDTKRGLGGAFLYDADLFEPATVERITSDYETVLRVMVERPDATLSEVEEILKEADRQRRLARERKYEEARLRKFSQARRRPVTAGRSGQVAAETEEGEAKR